jgi:hypothetical protein
MEGAVTEVATVEEGDHVVDRYPIGRDRAAAAAGVAKPLQPLVLRMLETDGTPAALRQRDAEFIEAGGNDSERRP